SAGGVAAYAGLGVGDGEFNFLGKLEADGIAIELVELDDDAFEQELKRVAEFVGSKADGVETFLIHEIGAFSIGVEIGGLDGFEVGLLELVAGLECLVEDGAGKQVAHLEANES